MPTVNSIPSTRTMREVFRLFLGCALLISVASAQVDRNLPGGAPAASAKDNLSQATDRLKQGDFSPADVDLIAKTKGVQAIPDLKKQFELTQNQFSKDSIASALVKLGDTDPAPWDYLVQGVADVIASDAPSPQRFDSKGKLLPGLSPEFIAWAKAHNLTADSAEETVMFEPPAKVLFLGNTGDRRAIPLLRQALLSPYFLTQAVAADGLAQFQDKASIPLIIEACRQAPADAAGVIARSLLDFDDTQAQSAAKVFRPGANGK